MDFSMRVPPVIWVVVVVCAAMVACCFWQPTMDWFHSTPPPAPSLNPYGTSTADLERRRVDAMERQADAAEGQASAMERQADAAEGQARAMRFQAATNYGK